MSFVKKVLFLNLVLFASNCNVGLVFKDSPIVENGVLNLTFWDFEEKGAINLEGNWEIYWKKIYRPNSKNAFSPETLSGTYPFPSSWNKRLFGNEIATSNGYATFRMKILFPNDSSIKRKLALRMKEQSTAYELYLDQVLLTKRGTVGTSVKDSYPGYGTSTVFFETDKKTVELVLIVSNFHHRNGGIWNVPVLGTHEQIQYLKYERNSLEFVLGGSILIMMIYHFMLFIFRKNDFTSLYFALFCLITLVRVVSTGEIMMVQLIPSIPSEIITKFEYFSFFLFSPLFFKFFKEIFPEDIPNKLVNISLLIGGTLGMIVCFSPLRVYNNLVDFNYVILFLTIILVLFYQMKLIFLRRKDSITIFTFTGILIFFTVNDVLHNLKIIGTGEFIQIGVFIFLLGQSVILSRRFSLAFRDIEKLSDNLILLNKTYSNFVPKEFLNILNKKSITEVKLGNLIKADVTILISGIRDFTAISEKYNSEEIFELLNLYYQGVTTIIHNNKGFIDKFIGDEIIVLFPESPEDAVLASRDILLYLDDFSQKQSISKKFPIKIGIGIHSGNVTLGTLGGVERMDTTVIGNSIGIARNLESLTKAFFIPCIISLETFSLLGDKLKEEIREIDYLKLKGQEGYTTVYEFFGGESKLVVEIKKAMSVDFFRAITLLRAGFTEKAKDLFLDCQKLLPQDAILEIYISRCDEVPLANSLDSAKLKSTIGNS